MKKISKKGWIGIGVVAVLIIAWLLLRGGKKEEKVSFDTAKVENTNIQTSITATGTIEPVTSVTVGTQVSGIVSKLYVDYNSVVKKGQVIAELDRTNLISELIQPRRTCRVLRVPQHMNYPISTGIRPSMIKDWLVLMNSRMHNSLI